MQQQLSALFHRIVSSPLVTGEGSTPQGASGGSKPPRPMHRASEGLGGRSGEGVERSKGSTVAERTLTFDRELELRRGVISITREIWCCLRRRPPTSQLSHTTFRDRPPLSSPSPGSVATPSSRQSQISSGSAERVYVVQGPEGGPSVGSPAVIQPGAPPIIVNTRSGLVNSASLSGIVDARQFESRAKTTSYSASENFTYYSESLFSSENCAIASDNVEFFVVNASEILDGNLEKPIVEKSAPEKAVKREKLVESPEIGERLANFEPVQSSGTSSSRLVNTQKSPVHSVVRSGNAVLLTPPLRLKAKGLLERRGSNASLTLDLCPSSASDSPIVGSPPRESNVADEFLATSRNPLTSEQLEHCLLHPNSIYEQFWEIPMNHEEKLQVPGSAVKNRYRTILPNELSRVRLHSRGSSSSSLSVQPHPLNSLNTYINANYIKGYEGEERAFIATQGPMSNTVADFWLMVWQENCPAVVMITKLKEQNRTKCECYLPEVGETNTYDEIQVTVNSVNVCESYVKRHITLTRISHDISSLLHIDSTVEPLNLSGKEDSDLNSARNSSLTCDLRNSHNSDIESKFHRTGQHSGIDNSILRNSPNDINSFNSRNGAKHTFLFDISANDTKHFNFQSNTGEKYNNDGNSSGEINQGDSPYDGKRNSRRHTEPVHSSSNVYSNLRLSQSSTENMRAVCNNAAVLKDGLYLDENSYPGVYIDCGESFSPWNTRPTGQNSHNTEFSPVIASVHKTAKKMNNSSDILCADEKTKPCDSIIDSSDLIISGIRSSAGKTGVSRTESNGSGAEIRSSGIKINVSRTESNGSGSEIGGIRGKICDNADIIDSRTEINDREYNSSRTETDRAANASHKTEKGETDIKSKFDIASSGVNSSVAKISFDNRSQSIQNKSLSNVTVSSELQTRQEFSSFFGGGFTEPPLSSLSFKDDLNQRSDSLRDDSSTFRTGAKENVSATFEGDGFASKSGPLVLGNGFSNIRGDFTNDSANFRSKSSSGSHDPSKRFSFSGLAAEQHKMNDTEQPDINQAEQREVNQAEPHELNPAEPHERNQAERHELNRAEPRELNRVEQRELVHYWFTAWPDHKTSEASHELLEMIEEIERERRDLNSGALIGPVVVHCSAGIGRTGCFIATCIGVEQLRRENSVDILKIVCNLRLDRTIQYWCFRGGMVQTDEQYEYIHQLLHLYNREFLPASKNPSSSKNSDTL